MRSGLLDDGMLAPAGHSLEMHGDSDRASLAVKSTTFCGGAMTAAAETPTVR